jgi:hypothetical protein
MNQRGGSRGPRSGLSDMERPFPTRRPLDLTNGGLLRSER